MLEQRFELVALKSGLKSLRLVANQETFHPGVGPAAEARILHVEQQRLAERCQEPGRFVIWDVGLGAACNALTAIEAVRGCTADVEIHSFDLTTAAARFALHHAAELQYPLGHQHALEQLLAKQHVAVGARLHWYLHLGDFREHMLKPGLPSPHAMFYDPYSPTGNREMWTLEHLQRLRGVLDDAVPCLVTNYSRSTVVRVTWLMAGFYVGIGAAVGEKEQTTVASNQWSLLTQPLAEAWLKGVSTSHSSTPLREAVSGLAPMAAEDFANLTSLMQFRSPSSLSSQRRTF